MQHIATLAVVPCAPARSFGAIPDDDLDDRAALQLAFDACAGAVIDLEPGKYKIVTPPWPRVRPSLYMRAGALESQTILRAAPTGTELAFEGDGMLAEWRGIQLASHVKVLGISFTSNLTNTVEQSHMLEGDGPIVDVEIAYVDCYHPVHGIKNGDCLRWVGYPPASDGTNDKRIWDVRVHHSTFRESGRSGIAFHSGLHGRMVDGHYTTRFDHNVCQKISDQCIDGEVGTGDGDDDGIEIDHNAFEPRAGAESTVAIQIQSARHVWIHDNKIAGNIDLYGCDQCLLSDNVATLSEPNGNPVLLLRKAGTATTFRDELYTREASAGTGYVFVAAQTVSAPDHVVLDDVKLAQNSPEAALYARGIVGLSMRHLTVLSSWTAPLRTDAVQVSGSGTATGAGGIRTTGISMTDSTLVGPYVSGVAIGGSYAGTGTLDISRTKSSGATKGLRCEGIATGQGISGPITYIGNSMPPSSCAPLVP